MKALVLLLAVFLCQPARAQDDRLAKLQQSYMARFDELNQSFGQDLDKLYKGYASVLGKLQEKVQKIGKIEDVIPVRAELEAVWGKHDALPEIAEEAPVELKQLRDKFDESKAKLRGAHAKEVVSITDKMIALLNQESATLTKAGKIPDALAAQKMTESIGGMKEVRAARELVRGDAGNDPDAPGTPLLKAKWTVLLKSGYYIGPGDGKVGDGAYSQELRDLITSQPGEAGQHLVATAPSRIEFRFHRPVSGLQTELFMAAAGDVVCRILIDDKAVAKSAVSAADRERRKWKASFPPTQRFVLEVDANGANTADWLVLLSPLVTFAHR